MEIRKLALEELGPIYEAHMRRDFPPSELRPFASIQQLTGKGQYASFGMFEDGLAAYATFALSQQEPRALLLDYFAVDHSRRGKGVGGRFLKGLVRHARQSGAPYVLIEVESLESARSPAQTEERQRRIRFYQHNGCQETRVFSWLFGVEYQILYLPLDEGAPPSDGDVQAALEQVYRTIVPPLVGPGEDAFRQVCRLYRRD